MAETKKGYKDWIIHSNNCKCKDCKIAKEVTKELKL